MTVIFGGITLMLSDDFYIRLKAVLLNLVFAGVFLLSPWFSKDKKPLIQRLFGPVFNLSAKGWLKLNYAWSVCSPSCHFCILSSLIYGWMENIGANLLHSVT